MSVDPTQLLEGLAAAQGPSQTPGVPMDPVTPEDVNRALWNALKVAAENVSAEPDSRMGAAWASAVKDIAVAIVQLDPTRVYPQGVSPDVLAASVPDPPPPSDGSSGGKK